MERFPTRHGLCGLVAILLIVAAVPVTATDVDGRWGVDLEGGLWKLTEGYWDHSNVSPFVGLSLRRGLSERWVGTLAYRYGTVRPGVEVASEDAGFTTDSYGTLHTVIHNPTLSFQYLLNPGGTIRPYVGLGAGVTAWRVLDAEEEGFLPRGTTVQGFAADGTEYETLQSTELTLAAELGAEWFLSEVFSLHLAARYHILPGNDLDNVGYSSTNAFDDPEYADSNKGLLQGAVGLTYWFGGVGDADNDGLDDDRDRCPRAAEDFDGFQDEDGCPDYDNDQDGIPDDVDGCPLDPEDVDGFQDDDGCPDPDNDMDGILDHLDECPDQPEDFDGFQDDDGCPDPDNDMDGVLDADDRCPDTAPGVEVDEFGCALPEPEVSAEMQAIGSATGLTLEGVTFGSGSSQIQPASLAVLQRVAGSLKEYPDVRVEVRGHTDATGSAEVNRELSQRRAMAVRDALIQLGISPSRITAVGYGQDYPIAPNDTREGRAKNRRVELHRIR